MVVLESMIYNHFETEDATVEMIQITREDELIGYAYEKHYYEQGEHVTEVFTYVDLYEEEIRDVLNRSSHIDRIEFGSACEPGGVDAIQWKHE